MHLNHVLVTNRTVVSSADVTQLSQFPEYFQVSIYVSTFSAVSAVFVLVSYSCFPELRSASFTCVLWISVAAIGNYTSLFIGAPQDGTIPCYIQAFMQQFFSFASLSTIVLFIRQISSLFGDIERGQHIFELTHMTYILVWGGALASALVPILVNSAGRIYTFDNTNDLTICWIKFRPNNILDFVTIFVVWYIPLYVTIIYTIFLYIIILVKSRRKFKYFFPLSIVFFSSSV